MIFLTRHHVIVLVLAFFLISCEKQSNTPLRLGTNLWPGYEPLYLAQSQQFFSPEHIRLIEYPSASEVIRAFRNGTLDAAALTLDEVLLLRQENIPVQIILVTDVSDGADVIIAKENIKSMQELKDQRVAIESGALGAYVISRALEINKMKISDIIVVHLDASEHEAAFQSDEVSAAVTFEPIRTKLMNADGHEIFNSRQIPGEIVDVIAIHEQALKQNHDHIRALTKGWFKAVALIDAQRADSMSFIAKRLKITPSEVEASYEGLLLANRIMNRQMLDPMSGSLMQIIDQMTTTMMKNQLLKKKPNTDQIVNGTFIQ